MSDTRNRIRNAIESEIYVSAKDEYLADSHSGVPRTNGWLMDFRRVIFRKDILEAVAQEFWNVFKDSQRIQICGLESAALPIVAGISLVQPESSTPPIHAMYMRKSRKKDGLLRMIEGTPDSKNVPVVLVDDILNSGNTFVRQVEVLEELGYTVSAVWSILCFRDKSFYDYFEQKGIKVYSLFELNDFEEALGTVNFEPRSRKMLPNPFSIKWKFASEHPNYFYVVPKSAPVLDEQRVFFGSDSGNFWAINQDDGSTAWSYKVGIHAKGKSIFSSPSVSNGVVYFGAYDGNVYALDAKTGSRKWVFWEADYIGSSPAVAEDINAVFIGLEFGLMRKHGGIAALDTETGKKIWEYPMKAYTHSSPHYIRKKRQVVVGGNEGIVYLLNAKTGALQWSFKTGEASEEELSRGFSRFDIKESFCYDPNTDLIVFGNNEAKLFALNRKDGTQAWCFENAEFGYSSTPVIYKDTVIATSLDKHTYCVDLKTGEEKWRWRAGARIFASPVIINDILYVGANTGRLTELNPETGEELGSITVPERIVNAPAYNPETKRFFLPTFANEIYCLEREKKS